MGVVGEVVFPYVAGALGLPAVGGGVEGLDYVAVVYQHLPLSGVNRRYGAGIFAGVAPVYLILGGIHKVV